MGGRGSSSTQVRSFPARAAEINVEIEAEVQQAPSQPAPAPRRQASEQKKAEQKKEYSPRDENGYLVQPNYRDMNQVLAYVSALPVGTYTALDPQLVRGGGEFVKVGKDEWEGGTFRYNITDRQMAQMKVVEERERWR